MNSNLFVQEIAANDTAMKLVFDHVRNLGICAAVLAAAAWQIRHLGEEPWPIHLIGYATAGVLAVIGFWLFAVNQRHGFLKLLRSGMTRRRAAVIGLIYNLAAVTLIASILLR